MAVRCPFCAGDANEEALVCPTCNRDIAVPASLRAEHEQLLRKRDRLRLELAEAKAQLASRKKDASRKRKAAVGYARDD
jgi:hypothetical protein